MNENIKNEAPEITDGEYQAQLNEQVRIRREKLETLQAEKRDPFQITKYEVTAHASEVKAQFEESESGTFTVAGRLMSKRVMGKASFANLQDLSGNIQLYVTRDDLGEDAYKDFKKMDIGDLVGVRGYSFRTKTGEISLHAQEVTLLSKSLQVLPEKFHGLTNTDPPVSGRAGIFGCGNADAGFQCRRRCRPAF